MKHEIFKKLQALMDSSSPSVQFSITVLRSLVIAPRTPLCVDLMSLCIFRNEFLGMNCEKY